MWIKPYRSLFVVVRIRKGGWRFLIPVPLFLFTQILDALLDLAALVEFIAPGRIRVTPRQCRRQKPGLDSPYLVLRMLYAMLDEIRSVGRLRMAEVETTEPGSQQRVGVYVDFI